VLFFIRARDEHMRRPVLHSVVLESLVASVLLRGTAVAWCEVCTNGTPGPLVPPVHGALDHSFEVARHTMHSTLQLAYVL
jgi:hypothetical protein